MKKPTDKPDAPDTDKQATATEQLAGGAPGGEGADKASSDDAVIANLRADLDAADKRGAEYVATIDQLNAQLGKRGLRLLELQYLVDGQAEEIAGRDVLIASLNSERDAAVTRADELAAEHAALVGTVEAAAQAQHSLVSRTLRPVGREAAAAVDAVRLEQLLHGRVEIAFSNGTSEISGLDPVFVHGIDEWTRRPGGRWMLRRHVAVDGPAVGDGPYGVAGFALIDADGVQVAWSELPHVVEVPGGQKVEFRDTIIF